MVHFYNLNISTKLILSITFFVILVIATISILIGHKVQQLADDNANQFAQETAYHYTYVVKAELEIALDEARAVAKVFNSFADIRDMNLTRDKANAILKDFIEGSAEFSGIYVGYEPNAFDGKDAEFVNKEGHDATGRFIPYWSKDAKGKAILEPMVGYDKDGVGDYYQIPKKRGKESIIDPYMYPIQGRNVWMTSLVVPIIDNKKHFLGIVGIDFAIEELQKAINKLQIAGFRNAFPTFYSANGTIVFTKDSSYIGKNAKDMITDKNLLDKILKGEDNFCLKRFADIIKENVVTCGTSLDIGYTGTHWLVTVNIPESELATESQKVIALITIIGVIAVLIMIALIYLVAKTISNALGKAVDISEEIAAGNLNNNIVMTSKDEIGQLLQSFGNMQAQLRERMGTIRQAANTVDIAAQELSQGHLNLSQRTEEQSASLEQTAASMEEMTGTVSQNADNARQATQLAIDARNRAEQGGEVVGSAVTAMAEINKSSNKVADIISVIDEIAFQTNLLALNAAVEAARAGEQGRGFAVVATEVRNLAQRSASAAKEIKKLIQDSVNKVNEGTQLVNQSGKTLTEIIKAVKKVSDIVGEISAATQEQAAGIEQVNKAVVQMDDVTQQNAALVEEATAASESLRQQANALNKQVAFFRMNEENMQTVSFHPKPIEKSTLSKNGLHNKNERQNKSSQRSSNQQPDNEWKDF